MKLKMGQTELIRQLAVKKDPNAPGSEEGIRAQTKVVLRLRDSINQIADMINQAETIRKQLADVKASLQSDPRWKSLMTECGRNR